MLFLKVVVAVVMAAAVSCQQARNPNTTPVPILKMINKVNDDGSYTYGYEAADGSYKVETRSAKGDVQGKYGYIDETGIIKEVVYGAGAGGFEADGVHLPEQPISAPFNVKQRDEDLRNTKTFVPAAAPARKTVVQAPIEAAPIFVPTSAPRTSNANIPVSFNQFDMNGQLISRSPDQPQPVAQRTNLNAPVVPTQQFNDIDNSGRKGFSFSFEAPAIIPERNNRF